MTQAPALSRRFALAFLLWSAMGVVGCDVRAGPREAMADSMVKMMEAMGVFDTSAMTSMPMGPAAALGPSAWNPGFGGFGMPGASPWSGAMQDPSGAMEKGGEMMKQFSNGMNMPEGMGAGMFPWSPGTRLEGIWEGRNGELLIVRGNRFRIYPGNAGYVDGYLQLSGDRLAMYNPEDANIRPFEYAESDGRLVLRDDTGTLYLYQRLWLDKQRGAGSSASPQK